jgi:hypothetical protein
MTAQSGWKYQSARPWKFTMFPLVSAHVPEMSFSGRGHCGSVMTLFTAAFEADGGLLHRRAPDVSTSALKLSVSVGDSRGRREQAGASPVAVDGVADLAAATLTRAPYSLRSPQVRADIDVADVLAELVAGERERRDGLGAARLVTMLTTPAGEVKP